MRKKLETIVLRLLERFYGFLIALFILGYLIMSKKNQRRKRQEHKQQVQQSRKNNKEIKATLREAKRAAKAAENTNNNTNTCGNTSSKGRRTPIGVGEIIKHSSSVNTTPITNTNELTIDNCFPNKNYEVVRKPAHFIGEFSFTGQIGWCIGADRNKGAKLKFPSGEIVYIAFDALKLVEDNMKETQKIIMNTQPSLPLMKTLEVPPGPVEDRVKVVTVDKPNIVTINTAKKGAQYKVVKKPERWRTGCKFLGRIGVCILIDDRGIRLRFVGDEDISFEPDCLEEAEAIDLNVVTEITEDNVQHGEMFRIIRRPSNFGEDAENLVGKIGKAKWANYRGVCLMLEDSSGYVIAYDCLERFIELPKDRPNPVKVPEKFNASNVVIGRKYKFIKIPSGWGGDRDLLNEMGLVVWASDVSKGVRMVFKKKKEYTIPFDCIADLPRPDDAELIYMIRIHPDRILRIIKGLNKITKLAPVRRFIETGELPQVSEASSGETVSQFASGTPEPSTEIVNLEEETKSNTVLALIGPIRPVESGNPS